MEKISLSITIPALGGDFDFIVPSTMLVSDIIGLVTKILNAEYGISKFTTNNLFIDKSDNKMLRSNYSLAQMGISDGAELLLI